LVGYPFKEYWRTENGVDVGDITSMEATKTCTLTASNRMIDIDRGAVNRKVYDQDGITDLVIDMKKNEKYILRLQTPIMASEFFELNENVRWLQDRQSRMTILVSNNVKPSVSEQGVMQIPISSPVMVRIIVENTDNFHQKTWKTPSYFGDLMTRDFLSPIEAYRMV
jgi:hypothetical protein